MGLFKSKDEKLYIKIKKKQELLNKLKAKLDTADIFSKEKIDKQIVELKEEIKKMALQIKDGKLVPSEKKEFGDLKIETVDDDNNIQQQQPQQQQPQVTTTTQQQAFKQPTQNLNNENYERQLEQQFLRDQQMKKQLMQEQAIRQQMLEQQRMADIPQQQYRQNPMPPQYQMPPEQRAVHQEPQLISIIIEMTSGKAYKLNVEESNMETFVSEINAAIEDQAPFRFDSLTINGRYILSYNIE